MKKIGLLRQKSIYFSTWEYVKSFTQSFFLGGKVAKKSQSIQPGTQRPIYTWTKTTPFKSFQWIIKSKNQLFLWRLQALFFHNSKIIIPPHHESLCMWWVGGLSEIAEFCNFFFNICGACQFSLLMLADTLVSIMISLW